MCFESGRWFGIVSSCNYTKCLVHCLFITWESSSLFGINLMWNAVLRREYRIYGSLCGRQRIPICIPMYDQYTGPEPRVSTILWVWMIVCFYSFWFWKLVLSVFWKDNLKSNWIMITNCKFVQLKVDKTTTAFYLYITSNLIKHVCR